MVIARCSKIGTTRRVANEEFHETNPTAQAISSNSTVDMIKAIDANVARFPQIPQPPID